MERNSIDAMFDKEPNYRIFHFLVTVLVIGLLIWSSSVVNFDNYRGDGWEVAYNIVKGLFTPSIDMLTDFSKKGLWFLLFETVCIAIIGTIIGSILALPLAFLSAPNIVPKWLAFMVNLLIMMIRTVPAIVYGLLFIRVTGPGPFAGVMTMTFTSIGMLTKLLSEAIMNIDDSVVEAFKSMGATTWQTIRFGIIPQLSASALSTIIYRFDMNIRDATTLGLVGAGGIGAPLMFAINSYRWSQVGAILLGLILLVLLVEFLSTRIRRRLAYGE